MPGPAPPPRYSFRCFNLRCEWYTSLTLRSFVWAYAIKRIEIASHRPYGLRQRFSPYSVRLALRLLIGMFRPGTALVNGIRLRRAPIRLRRRSIRLTSRNDTSRRQQLWCFFVFLPLSPRRLPFVDGTHGFTLA